MRRTLAMFVLGCALLAGTAVASGAERIVISAHDLRKAAIDDRNAAEARYLNKTVRISGIVLSTGISRYMTPNVELSDREGGPVQAICVLPRLDAGKLSDFKPGQSATMSCRVHALSERAVILKECTAAE